MTTTTSTLAALTAGLLLGLAGCSDDPPSADPPDSGSPSTAVEPENPVGTPVVVEGTVRAWPATGPNRAGVYSWDPRRPCDGPYCVFGFMHNAHGSGNVTILIERIGVLGSLDGWSPATVAGYQGYHLRTDPLRERWQVAIEQSAVEIRLETARGTEQAKRDEARSVIDSMVVELRPGRPGFRLVFTLPTRHWDSG